MLAQLTSCEILSLLANYPKIYWINSAKSASCEYLTKDQINQRAWTVVNPNLLSLVNFAQV